MEKERGLIPSSRETKDILFLLFPPSVTGKCRRPSVCQMQSRRKRKERKRKKEREKERKRKKEKDVCIFLKRSKSAEERDSKIES